MSRIAHLLVIVILTTPFHVVARVPPDSLVGQRVVFLQNPYLQRYGFGGYSFSQNARPRRCRYSDLAGKTATVVSVCESQNPPTDALDNVPGQIAYEHRMSGTSVWDITLELDSSKRRVCVWSVGDRFWLNDVGFESEMAQAKSWIGKPFFYRAKGPRAVAYEKSAINMTGPFKHRPLDEVVWHKNVGLPPQRVALGNLEKVELADVPGWDWGQIVFVFRRSDSTLIDWLGHATGVNGPGVVGFDLGDTVFCQFDRCWWPKDPLDDHPDWTDDVKQAIRRSTLRLGMTSEMVLMSWGEPLSTNRTVTAAGVSEQWFYGTLKPCVYLEDGKISGWLE